MTNTAVTLLWASYVLSVVSTLVVVRIVGDRTSRRRLMQVGIGAGLAAATLLIFASVIELLLCARVLGGVTTGIMSTIGVARVVESAPRDRVLQASLAASVAIGAASAVGPVISGGILEVATRAQAVVFGLGAAGMLVALIVTTCLSSALTSRDLHAPENCVEVSSPPAATKVLAIAGAAFASGFAMAACIMSLGPSLLVEQIGVTSGAIVGLGMFSMGASNVLVQLGTRAWSARTRLTLGCWLLAGAACLMSGGLAFVSQFTILLAIALVGAGQALTQVGSFALLNAAYADHVRANRMARLSMAGYISAGSIPVGVGMLSDHVGLAGGMWIGFAALGLVAVLAAVLSARVQRTR